MEHTNKYGELGLTVDDMTTIRANVVKANKIFAKISKKTNSIKESGESPAVKKYLDSLVD